MGRHCLLARGRRASATLIAAVLAAAAAADVGIEREGAKLKSITLATAKGKIVIARNLWANTTAFSESGKRVRLIDPFMYSSHMVATDGKKMGGYWSKPEVFDTWKVAEANDPKRPGDLIVTIAAEQPGMPLRKEAAIALESEDNILYVRSRLTALEGIQRITSERQTIYLSKPAERYMLWVDGQEIAPEHGKKVVVQRYLLFKEKRTGVSVGVVFLDRKVQQYPGAGKAPLGHVRFRIDQKANGADCYWHKGGGKMAKGAAREQQYILIWSDGDLREKVEALSKQALAGELNDRIPALP